MTCMEDNISTLCNDDGACQCIKQPHHEQNTMENFSITPLLRSATYKLRVQEQIDPPLFRTKPVSETGWASGRADLRKRKNCCTTATGRKK